MAEDWHLLGRDGLCGANGGLVTGGGTLGLKSGGRSTGLTGLGVGGSGGEEEGGLRGVGEASGNEESEEGSVDLVVVESSKRDSTFNFCLPKLFPPTHYLCDHPTADQ